MLWTNVHAGPPCQADTSWYTISTVIEIPAEADWVAVINRIKPHTEFSGEIESGFIKMLAIGFGNHRGALNTHQYAVKHSVTAMTPEKVRIPIALATDREAITTALTTVGPIEPWEARVIRLKNTLEMEEMQVSEALMDELKGQGNITPIGGLEEFGFDADGNLPPIFQHQRQFDRQ